MPALNTSASKILVAGCALAVIVLTAGCAITFGYRHADWLIRWQMDHYLDLNAGQRRDVTTRLETVLRRHRTEALPQYERFLKEVQERVDRGLTNQDLDWVYASYDRFRADVFERLAPDGGVVLTSVTDKQIRHFEDILQKEEHKAARRFTETGRRAFGRPGQNDALLGRRLAGAVESRAKWPYSSMVARLAGYPAHLVAIPAAASAGTRDPDEASTSRRRGHSSPSCHFCHA